MTPIELDNQANAWVTHWLAPAGSPEYNASAWATDTYDLLCEDPETLWLLILAVHRKDQSLRVQGPLSVGMVENLLGMYGDQFIDRIEVEARTDPSFARLLGGVWQGQMSDQLWARLQAVWDLKGWDGIPDECGDSWPFTAVHG
jgi:hypothetical protein